MTADPQRDLSPTDEPQGRFFAGGLPAFVGVEAGVGRSEQALPRARTGQVPGMAGRRDAGWSPFPLDAIEID